MPGAETPDSIRGRHDNGTSAISVSLSILGIKMPKIIIFLAEYANFIKRAFGPTATVKPIGKENWGIAGVSAKDLGR